MTWTGIVLSALGQLVAMGFLVVTSDDIHWTVVLLVVSQYAYIGCLLGANVVGVALVIMRLFSRRRRLEMREPMPTIPLRPSMTVLVVFTIISVLLSAKEVYSFWQFL